MAVEKEIEKTETAPPLNAIFDKSSNFLIYATLLGIKVKILLLTQIRNLIYFFLRCILFTSIKHEYIFVRICIAALLTYHSPPPLFHMFLVNSQTNKVA